jgi:hypothetical protein
MKDSNIPMLYVNMPRTPIFGQHLFFQVHRVFEKIGNHVYIGNYHYVSDNHPAIFTIFIIFTDIIHALLNSMLFLNYLCINYEVIY